MATAIAAARSRLDALAPHLRDVLKATKPLQESLSLRLDDKRDELRVAELLPPPLLLLYANSAAYADVLGDKVVTVCKYFLGPASYETIRYRMVSEGDVQKMFTNVRIAYTCDITS